MNGVPEMPLDIVPYSRSSAGYRGGNDVDIVGVTGSIPVTPTIRPLEIVEEFGLLASSCEVPTRFIEPAMPFSSPRSPHTGGM